MFDFLTQVQVWLLLKNASVKEKVQIFHYFIKVKVKKAQVLKYTEVQ